MKKIHLLFILTLCCSSLTQAQSIPVGTPGIEDFYRRAQLLGQLDSSYSFTSRPLFPTLLDKKGYLTPEVTPILSGYEPQNQATPPGEKEKISFSILPVTWQQQLNSNHPEGLNDGAMIPARGYQTYLTGGVYAKYKWLSVQLKPELVYAQNKAYQGFPDAHPDAVWKSYYQNVINMIDAPERFGEKSYQKAFWGQSSIRLTLGAISLGLSNENLWWGPGIQNALLMTNVAPGFKHLTLNTVKPIRTGIGSFEGQLISGRLEASGYPNIDPQVLQEHHITNVPKPDDWRYLNAIVLSYQPKWVPGLFLGLIRSFSVYRNDMGNKLVDYLPVIMPITKKSLGGFDDDERRENQLASLFMRWVSPEAHQEIYLEYGREDHNYDLHDFMQEPGHSRAYLLGFRKILPLNRHPGTQIDLNLELTQLENNVSTTLRAGGYWYEHYQVRDGYTHNGQYLGAGIGTGGNMQTFTISWVKELKRVGLELKRVVHNNDFWFYAIKDYRSHWVDFGGSLLGEWNYKQLLFNARIETLGSINYQWLYDPVPSDPPYWWDKGKNLFNLHAVVGVSYCF